MMHIPFLFRRNTHTGILAFWLLTYCLLNPSASKAQSTYLFGSLHSHSAYSDGNAANDPAYTTAASCYGYVKDRTPQATFWGISDHNHSGGGMSRPDYRKGVTEADTCNAEGRFLALYGMEWGVISTGGHVLIYGIDSLIGWQNGNYDIYNAQSDYSGLFTKVAARGDQAFAYLAHMDGGDFGGILSRPYNATWDSAIVGMAIRSGPAFSTDTTYSDPPNSDYADRYQDLLAKGYHLAPGFDHDNHYINFGRAHQGRTVVLTDDTTSQALMQAFRSRRFYASDDWNARLKFTVGGYAMGSICAGSDEARIRVELNDPDNEGVSSIRIWYGIPGNGVLSTVLVQFNGTDTCSFNHALNWNSTYYYYAEITQTDGHRIWSAPVWYTRANNPGYELLRFEGNTIQDQARLEWSAINENGILRYGIERAQDGLLFTGADWVNSLGGNGIVNAYTWNDPVPLNDVRYYRLKIEDVNGLFSYSPVVKLDPLYSSLSIDLQPSLSEGGELAVQVSHNQEEPLLIEIFDATGRRVLSKEISGARGNTETRFDTSSLSAGHYTVQVSNSDLSLRANASFVRR